MAQNRGLFLSITHNREQLDPSFYINPTSDAAKFSIATLYDVFWVLFIYLFIYLFIERQHNGDRLTPRHTDMRGKNEIKQQVINRKIKSVNKWSDSV